MKDWDIETLSSMKLKDVESREERDLTLLCIRVPTGRLILSIHTEILRRSCHETGPIVHKSCTVGGRGKGERSRDPSSYHEWTFPKTHKPYSEL